MQADVVLLNCVLLFCARMGCGDFKMEELIYVEREIEALKEEIYAFIEGDNISIDNAERTITPLIMETVERIICKMFEEKDKEIVENKKERKANGYIIWKKNIPRTVLTTLGTITYKRTAFKMASGDYFYPVDEYAGIEQHQRITDNVSTALVSEALTKSYAKASESVTGGRVSPVTVLNKIRSATPKPETTLRKKVDVLHIDADEDHIKLQNGKKKIVPLISVYEGIDRENGRGMCRNIFHLAEFGKSTDELWEQALAEIERRYDVSDTKCYLHGDGGAWIRQGLEWLPDCSYVLDRYHVNKALKQATANIPLKEGRDFQKRMRRALYDGDETAFKHIQTEMLNEYTDYAENIFKNTEFLRAHIGAISIYSTDSEAANGGATEPHISHKLSARLSTRPMAWSEDTLKSLVPLLAAGSCTINKGAGRKTECSSEQTSTKVPVLKNSLGAPLPDHSTQLSTGKVTPIYHILSRFV